MVCTSAVHVALSLWQLRRVHQTSWTWRPSTQQPEPKVKLCRAASGTVTQDSTADRTKTGLQRPSETRRSIHGIEAKRNKHACSEPLVVQSRWFEPVTRLFTCSDPCFFCTQPPTGDTLCFLKPGLRGNVQHETEDTHNKRCSLLHLLRGETCTQARASSLVDFIFTHILCIGCLVHAWSVLGLRCGAGVGLLGLAGWRTCALGLDSLLWPPIVILLRAKQKVTK